MFFEIVLGQDYYWCCVNHSPCLNFSSREDPPPCDIYMLLRNVRVLHHLGIMKVVLYLPFGVSRTRSRQSMRCKGTAI